MYAKPLGSACSLSNKMTRIKAMRLITLLSLICLSVPALAVVSELAPTDYHYYHPATVKASQLAEAQGQKLEKLSVMSMQNGQLSAVPFQFEEYDELGMVYLNGAAKEDLVGEAGILDGNDLLALMYRDTSSQRWQADSSPALEQGTVVKELKFKQADGGVRYTYLVSGNAQRSSKRYVTYDKQLGEITGTNYFFKFKPKNLARAEEYRLGAQPKTAANLLKDSLFELKTSVVFKFMRFTFNSKRNLKMKPVAALHGPVRVPIILKAQSTFLGIPVFTMYNQFNVYDHAINAPGIEINKPRMKSLIKNLRRAARYLLEPKVIFQVDYKNFDGTEIQLERTSRLHEGFGVVDGDYNDYETYMQQTFLPGQWLWFNNKTSEDKPGWKILTTSAIPEEFLDLEGLNPRVIYEDEKASARPRVGFTLRGEKVALKELAKGLKIADKFFKGMKPYDLDGIFLAVIDGVKKGKQFRQILAEQEISADKIQELFDIFQLALSIDNIAKLVDMGGSHQGSIKLGDFLGQAGISSESASNFMGMFQMEFNGEQIIDDLPSYTHTLMQRLYLGYRDKIKNGVTIWAPATEGAFDPVAFNKLLNDPPRLQ